MASTRVRKLTHAQVEVKWVRIRGCHLAVPMWAKYIGKERGGRVVALKEYPVWDEELGELRDHLLYERTRCNTQFWYVGDDIESIFTREGSDIVNLSQCETIRSEVMNNVTEGNQPVCKAANVPIWERKRQAAKKR